ncbi:MAG: hypothetical protein ACPGED_02370 [Flavobacteriales bacterium]
MLRTLGILSLSLFLLSSSCRDKNTTIPFVNTDFDLNLNLPAYQDLSVVTGWIYVSGGSRGIIVYRHTQDQFVAFDRHSTYDVDSACQVEVLEDNITIEDDCSGSQWLIIDGSVLNGPAGFQLEPYRTQWNPPILRIYN